jgi:hypothetical protein
MASNIPLNAWIGAFSPLVDDPELFSGRSGSTGGINSAPSTVNQHSPDPYPKFAKFSAGQVNFGLNWPYPER